VKSKVAIFGGLLEAISNTGGNTMNRHMLTLATVALFSFAVALPTSDSAAQQMQRVSFKTPAANTKYTQQHFIDVGDVPGHQVRVLEIHRTFPNDPPVINGVKLKEQWTRGVSDYIDTNGTANNYNVYVMENGDKFFVRLTVLAQNNTNSDGSRKSTATSTGFITGGTGKFAAIRGIVRSINVFDPKAGLNDGQTEIEYSVGN
jgi:hypothetical protein